MNQSGINLMEVKERNRAALLRAICTAGSITRSALSEQLQLSPMTVTNITTELLQCGILTEVAPPDHVRTPGRTPMLLQLAPTAPVILGIFLRRSGLEGIVSDPGLGILARCALPLEAGETEASVLGKFRSLTETLLAQTDRPVLGLGISTAGVVDPELGSIAYITDFYQIHALPLRESLSQWFSFPIWVCNDMQAAGLCELYFGLGRQEDSFLYVGVTNGLGAAVISHRELLDACGEFGHMTVDCGGPYCTCGSRGCLELYAGVPAILALIETECGVRLQNLQQAAELSETDPVVYTILYNALCKLSYGLNNYLNLINVSTVVLGHEAAFFPDNLIAVMEGGIRRINVARYRSRTAPRMVKSGFGQDSPLFGSACVVLHRLFQGGCSLEDLCPKR